MFIRTMGCIYEVEKEYELKNPRYFAEGKYYRIKSDIAYIDIPEKLVVRTSDTLAELCDEFVIEYRDGSKIISIYDNTNEFLIEHKDEIESGYIKNVYGAIWTDKGLIYVAKMNDDGNLELL